MKSRVIKNLAYGFYILCLTILTLALGYVVYNGFKSASDEEAICERLNGELIERTGPTECVKEVIRFPQQEKDNALRQIRKLP